MHTIMLARPLRSLVLIAILIIGVGGVRTFRRNSSQAIAMIPLPLDPGRPTFNRAGDLTFLKAWELKSDNSDFGGISALLALKDGRFLGLSDAGTLIGFGITNDDKADRPFIAPLPGTTGAEITYEDKDSEGISYNPETGQFWVSYEAKHAIRRFSPSLARIDGKYTAPEMRNWGKNSGAEAIIRLPGGRFVVFSEGRDMPDGSYMALLFSGDPVEPGTTHFAFSYHPPKGYKATDGTMLPDGRLILLNRRISFPEGFSAKLVIIDPAVIKANKAITGKVIATLKSPYLVDNMEGITTTQENGRDIVWIISDNNFSFWQRTLLMKFALNTGKKKPEEIASPGFESF
jgi:hypothetical protein